MTVQLLRNTRLWVSTAANNASITPQNTWEVLIQDDFSFNQDSNTTDIGLNEAGPRPTRGSKRFNDSLNPADWNFSTYLRPYLDAARGNVVLTPDYALWHSLASGSELDISNTNGVQANDTNMLVKFEDNQYHELAKLNLYYLVDTQWYQIEEVQINQAELSVDIDGIGLTAWTGQGTRVTPLSAAPFAHTTPDYTLPDTVFNSAAYIRNKLTTLFVRDNGATSGEPDINKGNTYNIPITGGSVTINNNITYLTPSTLSRLDVPIGSFTGTFEVTGSLEAYLRTKEQATDQDTSANLLSQLNAARDITNSFQLGIAMGGDSAAGQPAVVIVLPRAHLSIPTIETADVLGTTIEFKGIGEALDSGDEVFLGMSPQYTTAQIQSLIQQGDGAATLSPAPAISTQPMDESLTIGDDLNLSVVATDAATYQWFKDGVALQGATAATYTKTSVVSGDAGSYVVHLFNSSGDRTISDEAAVTVS